MRENFPEALDQIIEERLTVWDIIVVDRPADRKIDYSKIYSPSKIYLFAQCPQQYYFCYLDPVKMKMKTKLKQMPENIYPFHTLGKAVHNAITLYYHLPLSERTEENLLKKLEEAWVSEVQWRKKAPLLRWGGFKSTEEERVIYVEAIKMLRNFLKISEENPTVRYLPTKNFRHSIKDYQDLIVALNDDYDISGKFDLIIQNDDGSLHIIDFKTAKKEETDPFQLDFYQLLAELNFNKPVKKASFYFLKSGKKKSFKVKKKAEEIKNKVLGRIEKIQKTEEWQPKPSKLCQYCLFTNFCPDRKEAEKIIKKSKEEDYLNNLTF